MNNYIILDSVLHDDRLCASLSFDMFLNVPS